MNARNLLLPLSLAALPAVCGPAPVSWNAERHTVSFYVVSTDCGVDTQLEFLFVGPNSDRDYESMFITKASVTEIAEAFDKAGFPKGSPAPCSARLRRAFLAARGRRRCARPERARLFLRKFGAFLFPQNIVK